MTDLGLNDIDNDTKPEISRFDEKVNVKIKKLDSKMPQNP